MFKMLLSTLVQKLTDKLTIRNMHILKANQKQKFP